MSPLHMTKKHMDLPLKKHTVDGRNPANQLMLVVYSIIYRAFYNPGGAGFLPSTVWMFSSPTKKGHITNLGQ